MLNKINLDLPEKSYQIIVGSNILEQLKIFLQTKNCRRKKLFENKVSRSINGDGGSTVGVPMVLMDQTLNTQYVFAEN